MPQHGVTTVVTGNCSLSLTPVRAADRVARQRRVRLHRGHPRRRVHDRHPVDVGVVRRVARRAAGARHRGEHRRADRPLQPARLRDGRRRVGRARRRPRSATQLAAVLAESLAAGALGLSTSFVDQDRHGHAVPSRAADDDEFARADRRARRARPAARACSSSCPGSRRSTGSSSTSTASRAGAAPRAWRARGTSWRRTAATRRAPSASSSRRTRCTPTAAACTRRCRRGRSTSTSASTRRRRSSRSRRGAGSSPQTPDEKRRRCADPAWRAAGPRRLGQASATASPSSRCHASTACASRRCATGEEQFLDAHVRRRRRGARRSPVGRARRLGARARPRAGHGGRGAVEQRRRARCRELIVDATTVVGASDAGAHLQMMCGAGDSTLLLTEHVRDRGDLTVEPRCTSSPGASPTCSASAAAACVAPGHAGDLVGVRARRARLPARRVRARPPRRRARASPARPVASGSTAGRRRRHPGGRRRHRRPPRPAPSTPRLLASISRLTVVYTRQL